MIGAHSGRRKLPAVDYHIAPATIELDDRDREAFGVAKLRASSLGVVEQIREDGTIAETVLACGVPLTPTTMYRFLRPLTAAIVVGNKQFNFDDETAFF